VDNSSPPGYGGLFLLKRAIFGVKMRIQNKKQVKLAFTK